MVRSCLAGLGAVVLIWKALGLASAPSGWGCGVDPALPSGRCRAGGLAQCSTLGRGCRVPVGVLGEHSVSRVGNCLALRLRVRGGDDGGGEGEGEDQSEIELQREGEADGDVRVVLEEEVVKVGEAEKAQAEYKREAGDERDGIKASGDGKHEWDGTLAAVDGGSRVSLLDDRDADIAYDDPLDDPELDPAVQYFLTRCPSGRADKGTYAGSCRYFLTHLVEASADGQVTMKVLNKVFAAIEEAGLWVEMGMFNCIMTMVVARARHGDATLEDGEEVMRWFKRANQSNPELYHATLTTGGKQPLRREGLDSAYGIDLWTNFSEMDVSLRNYNFSEVTDTGGNTLRSVYEALLCVCVGAAEHNKATLQDAYNIVDRMKGEGIDPDSDTYTALLMVVAGAASQGGASMDDASKVLQAMREEGLEASCITYGAWVAVVCGCAGWNGSTTVREGEAIVEIMFRRGIRPDVILWQHLMQTISEQARLGVPTHIRPGLVRYDPVNDAERVIAMMKRVEPRMWPDDATILHYLSAVLHATNHGCAGVSEAWGCYGHFNAVLDSIATDRMGGLKRVEHWLGGTDEFLKGPDCELFNRYFSSESATCNGCVHLVSTDLCNNPCVHLAAHLWCATIYACNGNSMLQVVEASMRWNNATLQDAAAVLREMEASGVVGDSVTRQLVASMEAMSAERGEEVAEQQQGGGVAEQLAELVAGARNTTQRQQDLRNFRLLYREPKIWWKDDVNWEEPPPAWGNDPWNGLKSN